MKLARLTKYPVKSMTGYDLAIAYLGRRGIDDDRRWAVVYSSGIAATRRELPGLANLHAVCTDVGISLSCDGERIDVPWPIGAPTTAYVFSTQIDDVQDAGNYAAHFLSSALEREVRLVYMPDTCERSVSRGYTKTPHSTGFADGFPLLISTMPSLLALNAELTSPVEMRRFRPNIMIDGDFEPWAEDEWRLIRIGTAVMRIVKPCERCVMVTQDPTTGTQTDRYEPLATLKRLHRASNGKVIFGQNAVIEVEGTMKLGDEVTVLERGTSNLI
ncbi:MOSC domain-containing protein [Pacificibacter marinus]|jgi:uncharacterized protein|uniref:MOSC domain protein n=1 Tax=Pacificibacter marinus TaxID=658057 RepID=A0A1Y5S7Z4_9RHOB|nr:MOSC domain-containing protein [Pacificibacter marinus]SEK90821.1 hypothetical protein SAMN04488032_10867 [Pacificibacter marinus]SLN31913.1 MOSC domain protein [Pacificibacter marinus]